MANYRALAAAAARRYGIDPQIFLRQIGQESGFNPNARSPAGAQGIAQFMPATARGMGVNPRDPRSSLFGAARMDAQNLHRYGGRWQDVLSAYNSGRPWAQGRNISETRNYVRSILGGAQAGGAAPGPGPGAVSSSAAPGLSGTRQALARNLIAASQASARGQTPDYSQTFSLVAALHAPGGTRPLPVLAQGGVPQGTAQRAIKTAEHFLGTPYHWGGSSPRSGFDCSGLLQWSWAQAGVRIPRTSQQQFRSGVAVPRGQLRAGDAVFFEGGPGGPGHVGMMIDASHFIEAPHTGAVVRISRLAGRSDFAGARRFH